MLCAVSACAGCVTILRTQLNLRIVRRGVRKEGMRRRPLRCWCYVRLGLGWLRVRGWHGAKGGRCDVRIFFTALVRKGGDTKYVCLHCTELYVHFHAEAPPPPPYLPCLPRALDSGMQRGRLGNNTSTFHQVSAWWQAKMCARDLRLKARVGMGRHCRNAYPLTRDTRRAQPDREGTAFQGWM